MAAGFETFDLGRAIATAEGIKQMRRQSAFDTLREQAMRGQISAQEQEGQFAKSREEREATRFTQEQQINGTRLLNAAAAEISADPSDEVLQRWLPQLTQAGIQFGANPMAVPPEVRQQYATKLFQSTSAALSALAPQKATEEPTEIRALRALQKEPELLALHQKLEAAGASNNSPANVQEWQYYSRLSPEQKKEYLEMKRAQQTFLPTIAEVPTVVRPGVAGNPTEMQPLTTLPEVSSAAATVAGAEAGAKTAATAAAEKPAKQAEFDRTLNLYEQARKGLMSGLEGTATGPIVGRAPALTAGQQVAEGGVSAMAPVLKQIFRVAGEGTFTDRDQALLLNMVPTRTDKPEARRLKMQNIDNIVRAKMGLGPPADSPTGESDPLGIR